MSSYDRPLVELLVQTIWDEQFCWGMVNENPADPSMPKAKTPKNTAGTLWAHLADIRRAWDAGVVDRDEAAALLLVGGMGMPQKLAGFYEGVSQGTMSRRWERGVGRLMDYLNGTDWSEEVTDLD